MGQALVAMLQYSGCMIRLALAAVLIPLALSIKSAGSRAQEAGDAYWQLVPNGIVADERIQYAILLLTDVAGAAEEAGLGGALLYGRPDAFEFVTQIEEPEAEAKLLMAAAGFDMPSQVIETRRCRFWVAPDAASAESLTEVGVALGAALADGFAVLDIEIQPCEATSDKDAADILIWEFGQDHAIPDTVFQTEVESFLGYNVERPGAVPGGTGGGEPNVTPPTTGDGGLR